MYIVFEFCICYNANRQREMRSPCSSTSKQKPRCSSTGVFYFYFLVWKGLIPQAGYRLFVTVQPFDDVMANYTSRNSDNKRNDIFHAVHLPSVPGIGGGNMLYYIILLVYILSIPSFYFFRKTDQIMPTAITAVATSAQA